MKEITYNPTERIERKGLDIRILRKRTNAETPLGYILSCIKTARDNKDFLTAKFLEELYKEVFIRMKTEKIKINSWRGKGGIKLWSTPDSIVVEFAGKRGKDDKPNIKTEEYSKEDINKMIISINKLKEEYKNRIPSRFLGEDYYKRNWDSGVFSKRSDHQKFTHLLNILDYYKIIEYNRSGYTSVIKEIKEIQEVLK